VEVDSITYDDLTSDAKQEDSATVKARVNEARRIQRNRFEGSTILTNAEMGEREIRTYCALTKESDDILRAAFEKMKLSARARARIIKVARTIADLDQSENVLPKHVYEAVSYRIYDKLG
jgi:magnesium chelatase family protein